jgi:glycosyltransferase involved in cell wall biosynthesis
MKLYVFYPFVSSFGGIERLIVDLHFECARIGVEVELVCFRCGIKFDDYSDAKLAVHELSGSRNVLAEMGRLRGFCRRMGVERNLLVMEMYGAMYAATLSAGYGLHIADTPSLLPRDMTRFSWSGASAEAVGRQRPHFFKRLRCEVSFRLMKRGVRRAGGCATMTNRNSVELERLFGVGFGVVSPGIAEWRGNSTSNSENCVFLSVCRLESSKRIDWVVRAFAAMPETVRANARLVIVGDGSLAGELRSLAEELQVIEWIDFRGHVSEAELEACYRDASVFLMPARQGYGLPGLESLARGLRLIVNRESGVSEILVDSDRALLIDDEAGLVAAMEACCRTHSVTNRECVELRTRRGWCSELLEICGFA